MAITRAFPCLPATELDGLPLGFILRWKQTPNTFDLGLPVYSFGKGKIRGMIEKGDKVLMANQLVKTKGILKANNY
ncbi:hypothetical protein [Rufibacter sp. XAAS-G3-1]|uniref:hypothetical protein n=1 Tax=Rufibacter sp. XAAS-G3-1 TaxID=2729134 RepID=UPI0015E74E4E|nr:hypothetical protein [Rufibacter sp. XAAS-G3-1]